MLWLEPRLWPVSCRTLSHRLKLGPGLNTASEPEKWTCNPFFPVLVQVQCGSSTQNHTTLGPSYSPCDYTVMVHSHCPNRDLDRDRWIWYRTQWYRPLSQPLSRSLCNVYTFTQSYPITVSVWLRHKDHHVHKYTLLVQLPLVTGYWHNVLYFFNLMVNRKVLLHERKRRTDRTVSSTPSALLSGGVGTYSGWGRYLLWLRVPTYPGWGGGVPTPDQGRYPLSGPGQGRYPLAEVGTPPPIWTWPG